VQAVRRGHAGRGPTRPPRAQPEPQVGLVRLQTRVGHTIWLTLICSLQHRHIRSLTGYVAKHAPCHQVLVL
jgi:hypothetical protein